jgi:hypothetical protein
MTLIDEEDEKLLPANGESSAYGSRRKSMGMDDPLLIQQLLEGHLIGGKRRES